MQRKNDPALFVAELLSHMLVAGGTAVATSAGAPVVIVPMCAAIVEGVFAYLLAQPSDGAGPKDILRRIQDERTAQSVETIRDALVEAMGLRPQFRQPIEELADAVQARENADYDTRFHAALLRMIRSITEATGTLRAIKEDTGVVREDTAALRTDMQAVKSALGIGAIDASTPGAADASTDHFWRLHAESLSSQLRDEIDEKGQRLWDELNTALGEHSWRQAFQLAQVMEQWLNDRSDSISTEVKIQGLLAVADVAVVRDSGLPFENRNDLSNAWRLLRKAEAAATGEISADSAMRLLRVRAKLNYLEGTPYKAHAILNGLTDPGAISLKLCIMLDERRWHDASDLAHSHPEPHKKWAATAISAHINAGHIERAEPILRWAQSQEPLTRKSCSLALVKAQYTLLVGEGKGDSVRFLADKDLNTLNSLQPILTEGFAAVFAEGPSSGLDKEALEMAILLGHVLRQPQTCQTAANQLAKWKPVSPELGRAVLRNDIAPLEGLADRLLEEQRDIFQLQMLAAMLLIEIDNQAARALTLLLRRLGTAGRDQQEEIAITVLIGAQYCEPAIMQDAYQKVSAALGSTHRLAVMLRAILLAKENAVGEARSLIESLPERDDHIWLQLAASLATQQAAWLDAAQFLHRISSRTGHLEAYRREADLWYRAGHFPECAESLEKAHRLVPHDIGIIRNLAITYHHIGRYADATRMYRLVWADDSHTPGITLNFANALVLNGDVLNAVAVLQEYLRGGGTDVELNPLLTCAKLLHAKGDLAGSIATLRPYWDKFDSDYRYLLAVLHLGYAANEEHLAGTAFAKLTTLLNEGSLPEGVMWKASLDDLRRESEVTRQRLRFINEQYRSGCLPWLLASSWASPSTHSYFSWLIRTNLPLTSDHPDIVAEFSIYSTNGFHVSSACGECRIGAVFSPPKGSHIVADMSALITLHRLCILELACRYFKKVYLPQSYRAAWVAEQARIPHHQPSQIQSQQGVVRLVEEGRIRITRDQQANAPLLDEYGAQDLGKAMVIRIRQLVNWLSAKGHLSGSQRAAVDTMENQPPLASDSEVNAALEAGVIVAKPLTLTALYNLGLLDDVSGSISLFIEDDDLKILQNDLRGQELRNQAGCWHRELVSLLAELPNVEFVQLPADSDHASRDNSDGTDNDGPLMTPLGTDSALLAMRLNCPLLADDRYLQQVVLNNRREALDSAFGSDALLAALEVDGQLSTSKHAEHVLRLIKWRYKFLIPSPSILREMAFRFKGGLPGANLREVAVYVQDCMRDAGLYGGSEKVDPPISMAMKLFTSWCATIAEFIVTLWWDARFTQGEAGRLTRWATRYLLPAWPRNLGLSGWRRTARVRRFALLVHVLLYLLQEKDVNRAHRVLNRVRRSLKITGEEVASAAESVIGSRLADVLDHGPATTRGLCLYVFKVVYGDNPVVPWRLLAVAQQAGVIDSGDFPPIASDEHVAPLRNRDNEMRLDPTFGPFAYIRKDTKRVTVTYLPDALFSHHSTVRDAALENLLPDNYCPKTESTRRTLETAAANIRADAVHQWVPAVGQVLESLEQDFVINLAGFRQSQRIGHSEGLSRCWLHLIRPTAEALLAVDRDGWTLLPVRDRVEDGISAACAATTTVSTLLELYDGIAGHLSLASPLDLGTQLEQLTRRIDSKNDVWKCLHPWLMDVRRPWRQYHACQALLENAHMIPKDREDEFWGHLARVAELVGGEHIDSDEAQVWRLEAELTANYLRTVDLGGYELDSNRPITTSWWASKSMVELLIEPLRPEDIAAEVRKWRRGPVGRAIRIAGDAWAWLSPAVHSAPRFVTLYGTAPRSVALLVALGKVITNIPIQSIRSDIRAVLRECFCTAVLTADGRFIASDGQLWMWDHSLLDSAKAFISALPPNEQSDAAAHTIAVVEELRYPEALKAALEQLPKTSESDALFLMSRARIHCFQHAEAADLMLSLFNNREWCDACAVRVPLLGWELISQGLLFLQTRQGSDWRIELPYVFLRLARASCADRDRAAFFLAGMTMSSLAGNTAGAIKALATSQALPTLRPSIVVVRRTLEALRASSPPDIGLRMQSVLSVLDGIR